MAALKNNMADIANNIFNADAAIEYFLKAYLESIRSSLKFSSVAIQNQFEMILRSQTMEADLRLNLTRQINAFRTHISQYADQPENLSPENLIKTIVSASGP